jgi:DNA-binding response OmpR family regulator
LVASGSAYGAENRESFLNLWRSHIGFVVDYTTGRHSSIPRAPRRRASSSVASSFSFRRVSPLVRRPGRRLGSRPTSRGAFGRLSTVLSTVCAQVAAKDIWSRNRAGASVGAMAGEAVLLVEDEAITRTFLEQQLSDDGFDVLAVGRGGQALDVLERSAPDLVLLDVALPDASGFELCRRLREGEPGRAWNRDTPVIMVSERSEAIDRVRGFARGADDYVVKPFVYEELVARMRAVLRRAGGAAQRDRLAVGEIEIDRLSRTVRVSGEMVALSAKEYDLLVALAAEPERVFHKDELLRDVWGFRSLGRTRTLDSHASRLRRKLNGLEDHTYVINVWGVGYRLIEPVR